MKAVQKSIKERKMVLHLLFCGIVAALLFTGSWALGAQGFDVGELKITGAHAILFIACIYTGRWLCIRWYLQHRLVIFLLATILCCVGAGVCWWLIIKYVFGHSYAGFYEVMLGAVPFFIIGIILGILIKLTRETMRRQVKDARAATEQKQSELTLLQSQLSPHFLFNTLNNMYSISIVQHELIPGLLLQLSDLLRYTVYGAGQTSLPLKEELAYIHNYIAFEKIRIGDRLLLETDIEPVADPTVTVPPMLLIVFIENAFKHAKNTFDQKIYINISLKLQESVLRFTVKNSYGSRATDKSTITENAGMGLSNTKKRLDLLYAGEYELKQWSDEEFYTVALRLNIK